MRRLILVLLSLALGSVLGYGINLVRLTYTGYCFAKDKYLSTNEYIVAALQHVERDRKAADSTPEEYLRSHPDCCRVYLNDGSWFDNLMGFYHVEVELNFELKPARQGDLNYQYYTSYVSISACGAYLEDIGENTRTLKKAYRRP